MQWDSRQFPLHLYRLNKEDQEYAGAEESRDLMPAAMRLMTRSMRAAQRLGLLPRQFRTPGDMQRWDRIGQAGTKMAAERLEHSGQVTYLAQHSSNDRHLFRVEQSFECTGFEDLGTTMMWYFPPAAAGFTQGWELGPQPAGRMWQAVERRCIGRGDPVCEVELFVGDFDRHVAGLQKDSGTLERIQARFMEHLGAYLLDNQPLPLRPAMGANVHLHNAFHAHGFPHLFPRYQIAVRMGGARLGQAVGEMLISSGLPPETCLKRLVDFMRHCKVGQVQVGETIRIGENVESLRTRYMTKIRERSCYFTTGLLTGFFTAVSGQGIVESKCIAARDGVCEWEIN